MIDYANLKDPEECGKSLLAEHKEMLKKVEPIARKNGWIVLPTIYAILSTFYYDKINKKMYELRHEKLSEIPVDDNIIRFYKL